MEYTPAHYAILSKVFREWALKRPISKTQLLIEHRNEQRLVKELEEEAHAVIDANGMRPTLIGVLDCKDEAAKTLLENCGEMWGFLDKAFVQDPEHVWTATEIARLRAASNLFGDLYWVQIALEMMTELRDWYDGLTRDRSGRIASLRFRDGLLNVKGDNWLALFGAQRAAELRVAREVGPFVEAEFARARGAVPKLVFVSHSRATEDEELATALDDAFKAAGVPTFKASRPEGGMKGGAFWFNYIFAKLCESTGLIYVATPKSVTEHWPTFEVGVVAGREHPSFAVLTQGLDYPQMPDPLKGIQNISVKESDAHVRSRIADATGLSAAELWSKPEAAEKLAKFLELARRVPPTPSKGPEPVQAIPRGGSTIRERLQSARNDWEIERETAGPDLNRTKAIMGELMAAAGELRVKAHRAKVQESTLNRITDIQKEARGHQTKQPSGTYSRDLYYADGFSIIIKAIAFIDTLDLKGLAD